MTVQDLAARITEAASASANTSTPFLAGLTGGVAAGKSVLAGALAGELGHAASAAVICTDCFLYSNSTLSEQGALMRKGRPDTFDEPAIVDALQTLRAGKPATVPVYSHHTYDILEGEERTIEPADVVIVEGLNVLQPTLAPHLDLRIYLDAAEEHIRLWYVTRFRVLHDQARSGGGGFYAMFATMSDAEVIQLAEATWDAVNGPNLRQHIEPTKSAADLVVTKGPDHSITAIEATPPAPS